MSPQERSYSSNKQHKIKHKQLSILLRYSYNPNIIRGHPCSFPDWECPRESHCMFSSSEGMPYHLSPIFSSTVQMVDLVQQLLRVFGPSSYFESLLKTCVKFIVSKAHFHHGSSRIKDCAG